MHINPCIYNMDIVLEGAGSNTNQLIMMTQVNTDTAKQSMPAIYNEIPITLFNKNSF